MFSLAGAVCHAVLFCKVMHIVGKTKGTNMLCLNFRKCALEQKTETDVNVDFL